MRPAASFLLVQQQGARRAAAAAAVASRSSSRGGLEWAGTVPRTGTSPLSQWRIAPPVRLMMNGAGGGGEGGQPSKKGGGKQKGKGGGAAAAAAEEPLTGAALTAKENELKLDRLNKAKTMEAEGRSAFGATTYPVSATVAAINEKCVRPLHASGDC